jgi:type III secretion system (T3SS) inner membrane Yop/YscD-like protein
VEGSIVDTRDGRRRPFRWQPGTVVFGSGVEADLVLPDPAIAAKHGCFEVTEQGCKVVVEEGKKPVKVNGISTHESDVEVGDVVKIGPFQLSLASTAADAPAPAEEAPEEAAPPPPPPPPVRRPAAPSRHAPASARASAARVRAPRGDEAELEESPTAARYRARAAGQQTSAQSWLIGGAILAGIALIAVGFIVFSGNPWAGLADDSMIAEQSTVNEYIKNCDFDNALARIHDGMDKAKDSSVRNKWIDLRDRIERARNDFNEGRHELDRIRNTVGKRQNYYIVNDDLPFYINKYGMYAPLAKEAEQLREELRAGKMTSTVPAGTSEADLAPGQAAPAFEKRNEHAQGKEGSPKDPPIKDSGKDGHQ